MTDNSKDGKWASEAYDFIRLLTRVNHSFFSFILYEIGWVLFLLLIMKLFPENTPNNPASFPLPWLSGFTVRVIDLVLPGFILIGVLWFFTSGLFFILQLMLIGFIRKVFKSTWFLYLFLSPVLALNIVLLPLIFIVNLLLRLGKKKFSYWKIFLTSKNYFYEWANTIYFGISHIQSTNYSEDIGATKAPSQIFSTGIEYVQWKLVQQKCPHKIQFISLPKILQVTGITSAKFVKKLMGLDCLIWGSYLVNNEDYLWLNFTYDFIEDLWGQIELNDNRLFPNKFIPNVTYIVINQHSLADTYTALLLSIVEILIVKNYLNTKSLLGNEDLINALILEAIKSYTEPSVRETLHPKTSIQLSEIVGNWIAYAIKNRGGKSYPTPISDLFTSVMKICLELDPYNNSNIYRLAALECMKHKYHQALHTFQKIRNDLTGYNSLDGFITEEIRESIDQLILDGTEKNMILFITTYARLLDTGEIEAISRIDNEYQKKKEQKCINVDKYQELDNLYVMLKSGKRNECENINFDEENNK